MALERDEAKGVNISLVLSLLSEARTLKRTLFLGKGQHKLKVVHRNAHSECNNPWMGVVACGCPFLTVIRCEAQDHWLVDAHRTCLRC